MNLDDLSDFLLVATHGVDTQIYTHGPTPTAGRQSAPILVWLTRHPIRRSRTKSTELNFYKWFDRNVTLCYGL